ncbi:methionine ABC transporter ATP-binding protein [Candidatus Marinamargulisbacteria bacterium SCGC AG-410-N11]|nr:methionine ABC transporter ATP-binding protein [Candidatus Marinamargulisbacteria bacterium SCGC AG-410-N11]
MTTSLINISDLKFRYDRSDNWLLSIDNWSLLSNEHVFIEGCSGSGKSSFLNIITGLIPIKDGHISILNEEINKQSKIQSDRFRANHFGIIFQMFNLIPYLNVIENIVLACSFSKRKKERVLKKGISLNDEAQRLCRELDIDHSLFSKSINELSIGQQQRVAVARALIGEPEIIIADEPTSALDERRKNQFLELLFTECEKVNSTLVFVSHDQTLKSQFKKVYSLSDSTLKLQSKSNQETEISPCP